MEKTSGLRLVLKWVFPVCGILVTILGITLLFAVEESMGKLSLFVGLAMAFSGISDIISFFKRDKAKRSKALLLSGFISICLGGLTVFWWGMDALITILPMIFGIWIICTCVPRVREGLAMRARGSFLWLFMFGFGVLGIILGGVVGLHPALSEIVATYALAVIFISHGVNTFIMFLRHNKK